MNLLSYVAKRLLWAVVALLAMTFATYVIETLHERRAQTARAKGASESRVMRSHVLR